MDITTKYREAIMRCLELIEKTEEDAFSRGAGLLADALLADRLINVIGPGGHSNIAVEEVFWRAGGLVGINAILDAGTNLIHGAKRSNIVERTPGYARAVFNAYNLQKDDVLVIVNAYGINAMTIDAALLSRERGIHTIGITSTSFAENVPKDAPARHPLGHNLADLVDVYINNHLPFGDAVVSIPGVKQNMGSMSTFVNAFSINCLMMKTAEKLVQFGVEPKVWMSANLPDGDMHNRLYEQEYAPRIRHL